MIRRPPRSTQGVSSAASDVYKRQLSLSLSPYLFVSLSSFLSFSFFLSHSFFLVLLLPSSLPFIFPLLPFFPFFASSERTTSKAGMQHSQPHGRHSFPTPPRRAPDHHTLPLPPSILPSVPLCLPPPLAFSLSLSLSLSLSCLLYTSPSPRDRQKSRMPSSA